jgi:Ca-activated chloride channel family protein
MTFGDWRILWLLGLVPVLVVAYAFDGQRRRRVLERLGHLQMIARMTASSSPARRRWRAVLTVTALGLVICALARPQIPGRAKLTESRGLDLVVALDFSRSMLARDVYPSRLERAKAELGHLIDTLKGDRVGLIAFAGETMSYPLTVDYEAAKLFWRDLMPDDMPVGGTDLGRAIGAASELLVRVRKPHDKRKPAQVILLITDGEDTEGRGIGEASGASRGASEAAVPPRMPGAIEAAREAARQGIRIYTLGIGSQDRPYVQLYGDDGKPNGYLTDEAGQPVRVGVDEAGLRQMAALSGGDYFALDARRFGVERVQQAIAGLERTQEEARYEREPEDIGRLFLVPAFLLLIAEACLRERRRLASGVAPVLSSSRAMAAALLLALLPLLTGFDLFLRRDPNVEEGNRLLEGGKAEEALRAYDRAAEALPDDPVVRFDRGAALYQLGKYPEAQREFQRAIEGEREGEGGGRLKADATYNMGNALFKQERYKDALDAYKRVLGMRPEDRRAKWNLELALRKLREQEQKKQPQPDDKGSQAKDQQAKDQQAKDQQAKDQQAKDQQAKDQQKKEQQAKEPPREIDKQDAEAVLDALERVEPTVQKDLARRRAGARRASKDW